MMQVNNKVMKPKLLILASSSYTRKNILTEAGIDFEIDPSNYDEDHSLDLTPAELVMRLSLEKAQDVAKKHKDSLVLGADTMVFFEHHRLGKPHTPERAKEMLKMLSGREHSIITGFTLINTADGKVISKAVETKVFFKDITDKEIDDYIVTGEPLEAAGSYRILEQGANLIDHIEGSKTNVAGLPMEELLPLLK